MISVLALWWGCRRICHALRGAEGFEEEMRWRDNNQWAADALRKKTRRVKSAFGVSSSYAQKKHAKMCLCCGVVEVPRRFQHFPSFFGAEVRLAARRKTASAK
jgi:hypothetical protein